MAVFAPIAGAKVRIATTANAGVGRRLPIGHRRSFMNRTLRSIDERARQRFGDCSGNVVRESYLLGAQAIVPVPGSGALQHRGIGFEDREMGNETKGDIMKTHGEDVYTE